LPTNVRLLHGDPPHRINRDEPKPRAAEPECPVEASPAVKEIWDYVLAELRAMKLVTAIDRDALFAFCMAVHVHREASAVLVQTKILVRSNRSPRLLVRNPALQVLRDSAMVMARYAGEFGMTPSARSGIRIDREEPYDDLLG
jgi:P27 family predicted phage terminase small subunit